VERDEREAGGKNDKNLVQTQKIAIQFKLQ
jgi:hypothetical protein